LRSIPFRGRRMGGSGFIREEVGTLDGSSSIEIPSSRMNPLPLDHLVSLGEQLLQIKPVQIHHLDPRLDEVRDELVPGIRTAIDLGNRPQLRM